MKQPAHESTWTIAPFAWKVAALLIALKLLLHGLTANSYGYFRDELYFLDCARHMSWGYVDDAPMIAGAFRVALWLGGSLPVIRMIAAVGGAVTVGLTMALARELGGKRFAQGFAGLYALCAPIFLGIDSILCVGVFEAVFWTWLVVVLVRFIRTANPHHWLWIGVVAGLGLENKYPMLVVLLALFIGLLLTPMRRELLRPWLWVGAGIALLLFLPTLIWQIRHGFPVIEDMEAIHQTGKNVVLGPWAYIKTQINFLNPVFLPIWFTGIIWLFWNSSLRILGWLYVGILTLMILLHGKDYYSAAIYPMLFAAGAVAIEGWLEGPKWKPGQRWPKLVLCSVMIGVTGILVPAILPFLPPRNWSPTRPDWDCDLPSRRSNRMGLLTNG